MSNIMTPSIPDKIWHAAHADLVRFAPNVITDQTLMCCACGRFLPRHDFSLEHLIPRRLLKLDPTEVKTNAQTPENARSGNILLCKKILKIKGRLVSGNGCNGWKGRHYDGKISDLLGPDFPRLKGGSETHIIAALCLGYFAMVMRYGYQIAVLPSGRLMREQFFNPRKFLKNMPVMSQILLAGSMKGTAADAPVWAEPFSFYFSEKSCQVAIRSLVVDVPASQNPLQSLATHLQYVPSKYRLRADFDTAFC